MHRLVCRCLLVAIATPALLQAAPPDQPSRLFEGRDLFALEWATQPAIRPDGSAVAYVRNGYDLMSDRGKAAIWLIDTNTGAQTPLVTDRAAIAALAWSPDGTRLAYVASTGGKEPPRLYVRWMAGGQAAAQSDLIDEPEELTWSPDGRSIAFTAFVPDDKAKLGAAPQAPEGAHWADPLQVVADVTYRADGAGYLKTGYTHAFVTSADGGAPRQLTFGAFNEAGPLSFSTDGRFLFMSGNRLPDWRREPLHSEVYKVALADGALTAVTARVGPNGAPLVAPNGAHIAYLGFDDQGLSYQDTHLYLMDSDGSHPHLLGGLDRSIQKARWASDSRSLYIQYDDQGITKVSRILLDGQVEPVTQGLAGAGLDRPYTGGDFSVATNGTVAFLSGDPQHPPEVSITYHAHARELTHLNDTFLSAKTLAKVEPLAVQSAFDHRPIGAWLVTPPNFDAAHKYPLILEIHGGPFAAYGPVFSTDDQLYAAAGYVVVYANPRGSTSYGEAFADLINHDYPSHDYDDLMSVVDAAIARGFVDPQNLFVTGGSGGGLLTAWIVGHTDRFRAAASQKPVINWTSEVLTTDVYTFMGRYWFGKQPWQDPNIYWQHSPLSFAGCVSTPTLVDRGRSGLSHPGERCGAVFRSAAAARGAHRIDQGSGRLARRTCRAALAIGRQGERHSRLVRPLSLEGQHRRG